MAKPKVPKEIKVDLSASDNGPPSLARTIEDIQKEYSVLAARSGQLQYQVFTLKKDLELLNNQMRDLNFEAAAIKGKEAQNG